MFVLAFRPILLLILLLIFTSCKIKPAYDVTGVIIQKDSKSKVMLIDHDRIEGFMEPMIMNFNIHNDVDMDQFQPMDSIKFNLVITDDSHYAINLKIIGKRINSRSNSEDDFLDEDGLYTPKKIGQIFNNVTFTRTNGTPYKLYDSNKEFTIISYIFSRCPIPEMCPAIISKNQFLADSFDNKNIEFILISFDYIYDTPEVLSTTYGSIESSYPNIIFLSSVNHYNDLTLLTKQSDISFGGVEENNIGHTMRTIVLDKNRKLLKVYEGYDWKPSDFKRHLSNFMSMKQ